jgi:hypothetical protein
MDDNIEVFDDSFDWLETSEDDVQTSRARARRMLAEQVKWLHHYERAGNTTVDPVWQAKYAQWARETRDNIMRLQAGEFGSIVPVKPVPKPRKPRAKKVTGASAILASIEAARAQARAQKA